MKCTRNNNIKMDLKERGCEDAKLIETDENKN
jgi:hypothetical protein